MTQPDFQAMNRQELRAYVLQHRDDLRAVRALIDKSIAESSGVVYPAPQSIDDLSHFSQLLKESGREQKDS
ncbi:MAG: hypothetical protein NW220_09160 [Leptolyngbyaceae cyanobacterium bins.349]|nr:hypothetical protein [Leptolyngbyaceae cyanobacterium bins.349]